MLGIFGNTGLEIIPFDRSGYRLGGRTLITATGASTYTTPTDCKLLLVCCLGSGGGGVAAPASTAGNIAEGTGGMGGALSSAFIPTISGLQFTATVGAGGASGVNGAATSFAYKVNGAIVCTGTGGNQGNSIADGATDIYAVGGNTNVGAAVSELQFDSNRGIAAHRKSGTVAINGKGGAGLCGGRPVCRTTQGVGTAGGQWGAGGSGGLSINAGGTAAGGAGKQGIIVVWEFY